MGKAKRNRAIRRRALIVDPTGKRTRGIARSLRRHGRIPLNLDVELVERVEERKPSGLLDMHGNPIQ